jgi:chemotaxis protein CheD
VSVVSAPQHTQIVGMGEIQDSSNPNRVLSCLGLGSCIAVCAYDPVAKVSGLAHIVLPDSNRNIPVTKPGKFADTAIPELLSQLDGLGAKGFRLIIKLAGGAQMIQSEGFGLVIQMGKRNLESTRRAVVEANRVITAEDVGGNQGRSVWLHNSTGRLVTKTAYGVLREL